MKMKYILLLCAVLVCMHLFADGQKTAADIEKRNLAIEFLRVKGTPAVLDNVIQSAVKQQILANNELLPYSKTLGEFYRKVIGFDVLKEELADLYAAKLSTDDLRHLIAFYSGPIGRRYVEVELSIPADLSRILSEKSAQALPEFLKLLQNQQK